MQMRSIIPGKDERLRFIRFQLGCRLAIAACALIDCWVCRFQMNNDGVSYLDMGDLYWKGNWQAALNPYWSPLYGWLTGLMFRLVKPSMHWEYAEVHLLNFLIILATLFCFEFFWRELLRARNDQAWEGASGIYAWILGYELFACVVFGADALGLATPDLLVAALVLVVSGLMLRFTAGQLDRASALLLGGLLGVGYLAKAAMLPFAALVIMTMTAVALRNRRKNSLIALTLLGLLAVSAPFVAALSLSQQRFTFGDSARLNQGWFVNGVNPNFRHWQGNGAGNSGALHPTRKVLSWPAVYEFATPVEGTYPVWYNPVYWYEGLDSSMHPAQEMKTFFHNMALMRDYLLIQLGFLTAIMLVMFFLSNRIKEPGRRLIDLWPILFPSVAVFLMYAMVHWEQRFTTGEMLVVCGAVMASTSIVSEKRRIFVLRAASLTLSLIVLFWVLPLLILNSYIAGKGMAQQVAVAEQLHTMGIEPGEHVALVGDGLGEYWARLEKVRIVAEVPSALETGDSATAFWNSGPEIEQLVLDKLKNTGAKAVIATAAPKPLPSGWVQIGNTGHAVYFFQ